MRNIFLSILLCILFCSCDKKYSYVEIVLEKELNGDGFSAKEKEIITITAPNDTIAYLEAYQKYSTSAKALLETNESTGEVRFIPKGFKLLNDQGVDISGINFPTREARVAEMASTALSSLNLDQEKTIAESKEIKGVTATIDSVKIKELLPYFNVKADEFSTENQIWYVPKSAPKYTNKNGIYCYFSTSNGKHNNLRIRIQYYSDSWLFINRIQFSIEGKAYEFTPSNPERDSGDGGYIWEWMDEIVQENNRELIIALSEAKEAKMKLIGSQYHDVRTVSQKQCLDIKKAIDLYKAMGGEL